MRRAATSMRLQMSCASGISNSPWCVSTTRSGVPGHIFASVLDVGDDPEERGCGGHRTCRGRIGRRIVRRFKYRAADQLRNKVLSGWQRDSLFEGQKYVQAAEFLGFGDRCAALKVKYCPAWVISVDPERSHCNGPRLVFPLLSPRNTSRTFVRRWEKSVRSSAATSPLFPRARRMRASATQRCGSRLNLPGSRA